MSSENTTSIRPFVIECATPRAVLARPEFYSNPLAWAEAFETARQIGALNLFVTAVSKTPWFDQLPESVRLQFNEKADRERLIQLILEEELETALNLISGKRIPYICFGAMDYSRRFYPVRTLRACTEVNLMVPKNRFKDTLMALGKGSYRISGRPTPISVSVGRARKALGPVVKVHQALSEEDSSDATATLWERSQEPKNHGTIPGARVLSNEDILVHALSTGVRQQTLKSLSWYADLHFICSASPNLDWERIAQELTRARCMTVAWFALSLIQQSWKSPVPEQGLARIAKEVGPLKRRFLSKLTDVQSWFGERQNPLRTLAVSQYLIFDSPIDALRQGFRRAPISTKTESLL